MKKYCYIILLLLLISGQASAYEYRLVNSLNRNEMAVLPSNATTSSLRLVDLAMLEEQLNPALYKVASRTNRVGLVYSRDDKSDIQIQTPWKLEVKYELYATSNPGVRENGTLLLISKHGEDIWEVWKAHSFNQADVSLDITEIKAWTTSSNGWAEITAFDPTNSSVIPEDIRLDLVTVTERYVYLNPNHMPSIAIDANDKLHWTWLEGAEAYDVEWVFIDDLDNPAVHLHLPRITSNTRNPFGYVPQKIHFTSIACFPKVICTSGFERWDDL